MKDLGEVLYNILRKNAAESEGVPLEKSPLWSWEEVEDSNKEAYNKTAIEFLSQEAKAV